MGHNVSDHAMHPSQYGGSTEIPMGMGKTTLPPTPETQSQSQWNSKQYGDISVRGSAQVHLGDVIIQNYNRAGTQRNIYDLLLESLKFGQMDARLRSVEHALPSTCQWLFSHSQFRSWADLNDGQHQPFLWIKGKPGSGKSTIMKEMMGWIGRAWSSESLTLAYFFNARSADQLEKSALGLYRCLLHQILISCPESRDPFVERFAAKVSEGGMVASWASAELQSFQTELIRDSCLPPLVILIDALDEGDEDDVRQVIQYLSRLQQYAMNTTCPLRIALSSRHYPNITIDRSLSLIVEEIPGHDEDIKTYVCSELAHLHGSQFETLKSRIRQRSAGVFLWVVLVIPALKKAYDRGRSFGYITQKLDDMPSSLHEVFSEIIFRDSEDLDECLKLLSWVLFSVRPLSPTELYCALEHCSSDSFLHGSPMWTKESALKYLLHCSRGLVEVTSGDFPVVQLIHETVRDYLTSKSSYGGHLISIPARPQFFPIIQPPDCHMSIAEDCLRYLSGLRDSNPSVNDITNQHPLSRYAANCWWRHVQSSGAKCSAELVDLACDFLAGRDPISKWIQACGILRTQPYSTPDIARNETWLSYEDFYRMEFATHESRGIVMNQREYSVPPLYFAATVGIFELAARLLDLGADANVPGDLLGFPLTAASCYARKNTVELLLDHGADVNAESGIYGFALQAASCQGSIEVVQTLLAKGANVNAVGGRHRTALRGATSMGRDVVVRLLLEHGATTDDPREYYSSLQLAAALGHVNIARLLLAYHANPHKTGRFGSALTLATENDHLQIVRLLLEHGADPNEKGRAGRTPLHTACANESSVIVQVLLDHGADVNIISDDGEGIYQIASGSNLESARYVLLDQWIIDRTRSHRN